MTRRFILTADEILPITDNYQGPHSEYHGHFIQGEVKVPVRLEIDVDDNGHAKIDSIFPE